MSTIVEIHISVMQKDTLNVSLWNGNLMHLALFLTFHYQHNLKHITKGISKK